MAMPTSRRWKAARCGFSIRLRLPGSESAMGGIIGGGSNAKQQKAIGSLQFQTSQHGGVIPLVYGTTRVSPNLIAYDDFKAMPASRQGGGKGGGGGKGRRTAVQVQRLDCYGHLPGPHCRDRHRLVGQECRQSCRRCPAALYLGNDGQAPDPYWQTSHADRALGYSGIATVVANNYAMGHTATLPNFSFEVQGLLSLSGTNGLDANPAAIVADLSDQPPIRRRLPGRKSRRSDLIFDILSGSRDRAVANARHSAGGAEGTFPISPISPIAPSYGRADY